MEPISLENLVPQEVTFDLVVDKEPKQITLRPVSLADEVFLKTEIKGDLESVQTDSAQLCRFVFRLMKEESKALFPLRAVEFMDESGKSFKTELGGVALFMTMVRGPMEVLKIKEALLMAFGIKKETLNQLKEDAQKKTAAKIAEMEVSQAKSTGPVSLTPSQQSTAGQLNTSSDSHEVKSLGAWTA